MKNIRFKLLLAFFVPAVFFLAAEAKAATYWVTPDGSSAWAECARTQDSGGKYCSLPSANANAKAGDIVNLKGGVYSTLTGLGLINPSNSGSAGNPIVFQSAPGELAVLSSNSASSRGAIHIQGKSFIRITGLKVINSFAFFFLGNGTNNVEISHCSFENASMTYSIGLITCSNSAGSACNHSKHNWIHHNTFSKYGRVTDSYDDVGTIRIGQDCWISGSNVFCDDSSYNTFENNVFSHGGHDNFDLGGRFNVVRNNIFRNNEAHFKYIPKVLEGVAGDSSTDIFTKENHGLSAGWKVHFTSLNGGEGLKIGSAAQNEYYVRSSGLTQNNFSLSEVSSSGAAANFSSDVINATIVGGGVNTPASGYFGNRCFMTSNYGEYYFNKYDKPHTANQNLLEGNRIGHSGISPDDDGSFGIETPGSHLIVRYNSIYNTAGSGIYLKNQPAVEFYGTIGDSEKDLFTKTGHNLLDGDIIFFHALSGGAGLLKNRGYFILNASSDTFQISERLGGVPADFSSNITSSAIVRSYGLKNPVSGSASNDTFTSSYHGLWNGAALYLFNLEGGSGLNENSQYFAIDATEHTFKLSGSIRGNPIDFSTDVSRVKPVFIRRYGAGSYSKIYNNSVYYSGYGDDDISSGFKYGFQAISTSINVHRPHPVMVSVKNNIFYNSFRGEHSFSEVNADITYFNNYSQDPKFENQYIGDRTSLTLPNLNLQPSSGAIDKGTFLTTAKGSGANSIRLAVEDAFYFQDGKWGSDLSEKYPDWIAIGSVDNIVAINNINYTTNVISLAEERSWRDNDPVWLYKKSDGTRVLYASAPDIGAHEYASNSDMTAPAAPSGLSVR